MAYTDRYISIYTIIYNLFKSDIYEIMHYFNLQVKNELPVCGITYYRRSFYYNKYYRMIPILV